MKQQIVLFARNFYPENNGFANAATGLAQVLSNIPDTEVIVFTDTPASETDFPFENVKIHRINDHIGIFARIFKNKTFTTILRKISMSWFIAMIDEYSTFRASKTYLNNKQLACVIFDTGLYPFLGNKVLQVVPSKTIVRIHATADADGLMFPYFTGKNLFSIAREKWHNKRCLHFMRRCKIVTATTQYYVDFYKQFILGNHTYDIWQKIHYDVIPNTMDAPEVSKISYDDNGSYCLMVGKMSDKGWMQKGFDEMFNAILNLQNSRLLPTDFKLLVVGAGPARSRLVKMVESAGLEQRIVLIEKVERAEMIQMIKDSKFAVLPSRFEGHSIFLTEAMALSKPLLITHETGASHLVEHGSTGLKVHKGDYVGLSKALLELWRKSDDELQELGIASRHRFEKMFNKDVIQTRVETIIDIINSRD